MDRAKLQSHLIFVISSGGKFSLKCYALISLTSVTVKEIFTFK